MIQFWINCLYGKRYLPKFIFFTSGCTIFQASFIVPSNPFGWFFIQTWCSSLLCWIRDRALCRPSGFSLYSCLLSGTLFCDPATLFSLHSVLCLFSMRAPGLTFTCKLSHNIELGSSCLFSHLRGHCAAWCLVSWKPLFQVFCLGFFFSNVSERRVNLILRNKKSEHFLPICDHQYHSYYINTTISFLFLWDFSLFLAFYFCLSKRVGSLLSSFKSKTFIIS